MLQSRITAFLPHLIAVLVIVAINVVYFFPQFQGKVMSSTDAVQSYNMRGEFHEFEAKDGTQQPYYWNNSMFGGMPDKLLRLGREYNALGFVVPVTRLFIEPPTGVFIASMMVCYFSLLMLGLGPWVSLLAAILFGLNTNHLILWETGHALKNYTIVFFPAIFAGLLMVTQRRYWLGGILFAAGVSLSIYSNHPQMFYYLMMASGLFYVVYSVIALIRKSLSVKDFGIMSGVLVGGLLLGLLSNISQVQSTLSYGDVTMRGEPILKNNKDADPSSKVEGLDWEYSTRWSNGPKDILSTIIPRAAGGGGAEEVGADSESGKLLKTAGQRPEADGKYLVPLYHGSLPFTSGTLYIGALVMFLLMVSIFVLPRPIGIALALMTAFVFLISMGKNAPSLNKFLFDNLPFYNKFRAPTSIFHGIGILFVIPGVWALKNIIDNPPPWKTLLVPGIISAGLCAFFAVLGPGFIDFSHPSDRAYGPEVAEIFYADRVATFKADAFRSMSIIVLALLAMIGYAQKKFVKSGYALVAIIAIIGLIDLWGIGRRYLDEKDWIKKREYQANFNPRPIDKQIKKLEPKGRGYYRVHDLSINTYNSASTSYHHNTIGGYSAAKMQRIEDMIDRYIEKGDMNVFNMMNTKYIISPEGQIQVNNGALGNAWFVSSLKKVSSADEEITQVGNINVKNEAVVLESEFADVLTNVKAGNGSGKIEMIEYEPGYLKYQTESSSDQVAVFSEVWYPNSWEVSIDGEPAEMFRVNYLLRALAIPAGSHEVLFTFKPQPSMPWISLLTSLIILGLMGYYVYKNKDRWMGQDNDEIEERNLA